MLMLDAIEEDQNKYDLPPREDEPEVPGRGVLDRQQSQEPKVPMPGKGRLKLYTKFINIISYSATSSFLVQGPEAGFSSTKILALQRLIMSRGGSLVVSSLDFFSGNLSSILIGC